MVDCFQPQSFVHIRKEEKIMAATKKKGGLGREFDSLFLDNSSEGAGNEGTVSLPIGDIEPDKNQPRRLL